jgi:hypothetical protein
MSSLSSSSLSKKSTTISEKDSGVSFEPDFFKEITAFLSWFIAISLI